MLLVAVFAITALAALGAALININGSQADTTTREVLGARAWFAATSGTEMAMAKLFPLATASHPVPETVCGGDTVQTTFDAPGLAGCSVSVSCTTVGSGALVQYQVESIGRCGSGAHQVVRVQESWARKLAND